MNIPTSIKTLEEAANILYLWQEEPMGKNSTLEIPSGQTVIHVKMLGEHAVDKKSKETFKVRIQDGGKFIFFDLQKFAHPSNVEVELLGMNSSVELFGLADFEGKSKAEWSWKVAHQSPQTESSQLVKSILQDESSIDFTGKIYIAPKAQQSNAKQMNKNLLLSKKAKCLSRPELEIFADDVKCGHGLTTSQFREDELIYLQMRGIKKETAKNLLSKAFVLDVLSKIPQLYAQKLAMTWGDM